MWDIGIDMLVKRHHVIAIQLTTCPKCLFLSVIIKSFPTKEGIHYLLFRFFVIICTIQLQSFVFIGLR
jgi:hypothetical protein